MKILILGGFLGSGKTTLLLQMARDMAEHSVSQSENKVIILENEVGQDGIDNKLLGSSGFKVSSLFNGCICCTLSGEIIASVADIEKKYHPEWLIIETTGLAYPGLIRNNLKEALGKEAYICTLVDASRWKRFRIPMQELLKGQIECADMVLLNKADLVDEEEMNRVEQEVHLFREDVPCFRTSGLTEAYPEVWQRIREECS